VLQRYLRAIIHEESTPRVHHVMFREFLELCDWVEEPPVVGSDYVRDLQAGYGADLPFALGYALAIEVDADLHIAVLAAAVSRAYPKAARQTEWFDVHLDPTGEEQHASMTVDAIEDVCSSPSYLARAESGFRRGCSDTHRYFARIDRQIEEKTA
jgi:hypothetical protein